MKTYIQLIKYNFLSLIEYKKSFLIGTVSMIINNLFFIFMWYLFFDKFNNIGGWSFNEYIILFAIVNIVFGFVHSIFGGIRNLSTHISEGRIDNFLLLPKNTLLMILFSTMGLTAFGDLLTGALILILHPDFSILLLLKIYLYGFIGGLIFLGFLIFMGSLAFYIGSSKLIYHGGLEAVLSPSLYPEGIFEKTFLRYLFISIIPVYYIAYLPHSLVQSFSISGFMILLSASFIFLSLGFFLFYKGLKRYESGNMININN